MAGSAAASSRSASQVYEIYNSMEYGPVPEGTGAAQTADRPKVPRTRAATWSHRETLDFLALWGEEGIQAQLNRCHRNADVYQWISERMAEKGYFRDEDQCRTKGKDLKKSYKQAKLQDGIARQRCRFFHELDAILGTGSSNPGGGSNNAAPWCQVVIKEESDPELDPDQDLQEDEYAWTQVSVTDGSDLDPQGEPSSSVAAAAAVAAAATAASSSSSSQTFGGLLHHEDVVAPILHHHHHHHAPGGIIKEEKSPVREEPSLHGGGVGGPYLYAQEDAHVETPGGDIIRSGAMEEPLLRQEARVHLEAPWRPGLNRRAFPRPRTLLSTREKLAQLRSRRKRPRDDKFDELVRDIRTHFREREKLFQGLWEEEKAQREKDRRLWTAEMDWIRQMWAKSQKEREAAGEEREKNGPRQVKEENWNQDLCKEVEGEPLKEASVQEPLLLKAWLESHGRSFGHFINGQWLKPEGRETYATKNPTTGEVLATTLQGNGEDVNTVVDVAAKAFESWSQLPGHVRARHLYNVTRTIQKHQRLLSLLESLDSGKLAREARDADLPLVVRHFYHHAGWAQLMEVEMKGWKPLGVVAALIPRNFPLLTLAWKVCPALAMGNTVVLKPASSTRLTALLLAEVCAQAGLPPGVLNVVTGDQGLGESLAAHTGIDKVAFAGCSEAGRSLRRATAGTGKKLSLQLGGKSPFIVFDSADLDSAVDGLVDAIWLNRGQVHSIGTLLLLQESIVKDFIQRLKRRMGQLRVGDSLDKAVDLGALADEKQRDTIESLVAEARAEGAEIFQAWASLPSSRLFYPPTLITGVYTTSRCVREEIFGPVLVSLTFRTAKEAVALGNSTPYGLVASVWTETLPLALEVARSLQVGTVWINGHNMLDAASAFGGCKESGYGRDGGKEGLYEYVRPNWDSRPHLSAMDVNYKTFATSQGVELPPVLGENRVAHSITSDPEGNVPSVDRTYKLYYGGAQKRPDSMSSRAVLDHSGKIMAYVADGSIKDIRNAVEAAHKAAPGWAKQTAHVRSQILYYLAENLELRRTEVASRLEALTGAGGKVALREVDLSVQRLFYWAAYCDKYGGAVQETSLYGASLLFREPLGVVGIACPNEQPLLGFVSLLAPAVIRGNSVVIIPSEWYPLPALDFYQILDTSDVPGGVVNIISGNRDHLSRGLAEHQDVQAVWYFGSKEGSALVEWASAGNLKRTWVNYGTERRCWNELQEGAGEEFLYQATQCKSVWMPMGDIFAN
ncbi:aldehyde dehydrogenase family 16 member A1 [Hemicordylus capensis]|uniref:aldehyde dehydrogenase family 16 member A1 n=1 Tax=Hemicordylus capensis TaxID=884348 RepID=UPI00230439E6|nr:aldehyde dehydrogenase family 16 member A1 [Hemicordylus capensis]